MSFLLLWPTLIIYSFPHLNAGKNMNSKCYKQIEWALGDFGRISFSATVNNAKLFSQNWSRFQSTAAKVTLLKAQQRRDNFYEIMSQKERELAGIDVPEGNPQKTETFGFGATIPRINPGNNSSLHFSCFLSCLESWHLVSDDGLSLQE